MAETRSYCYQTFGFGGEEVWVDVPMYPPGTSESPTTPKEVWVAYLNYLRVIYPDAKYRLTETVTTHTTEVLDV